MYCSLFGESSFSGCCQKDTLVELDDFPYWTGSLDGFCWFFGYLQESSIERWNSYVNEIDRGNKLEGSIVCLKSIALVVVVKKTL